MLAASDRRCRTRQGGWLYAVEFSDFGGEVIHKICLTEQSDFEAFRSWVELNQTASGCSRDAAGNPRHSSGLENSLVLSASGAESLRTDVLRVMFQMASAERWAFQAFVGNDGAAQVAG
jgi:putative heme degradation protein